MALHGFWLDLETGGSNNAGTDGDVYIGLGGREFYVDSKGEDFERSKRQAYSFGSIQENAPPTIDPNYIPVEPPQFNDPRLPQIEAADVLNNPVYLRFSPRYTSSGPDRGDNWQVGKATLYLYADRGELPNTFVAPGPIWLGTQRGLVVHFRPNVAR